MADPAESQLLDVSSAAGTVIDEADFVWKTAVVSSASTASVSEQPPPPGFSSASTAAATQYRIALVTNSSALLWANVAWQRDGDSVVRSSMARMSATQFLGPPVLLQAGDVLTYQLSWWELSSNSEQQSPLVFVYRPPTAEALQLIETAASGSSTGPAGTNLGDGQSVWSNLKQAAQSSLGPLPAVPSAPNLGLGGPSLSFSSPASSSATASVVGAVSSGLATLLSSLSALQSGPAQLVGSSGQPTVSVSELPASTTTASSAGGDSSSSSSATTVSTQSLTDLITPLALIGSLAGLTSQPGSSSSLSSVSTYAGAAFCVLPCATSSPNSDVMVSCLGGCAQPFLPAGLSSSEATSVIDALHDYVVSNAQQAAITTPSSLLSVNQTTLPNATHVDASGGNSSSTTGQADSNSSNPANPAASPDAATVTPTSNSSQLNSQAAPSRPSILPQSAASSILNWLTGAQSAAAATTAPFSSIPSLFPTTAGAAASPGAALASGLSSGLGYLSTPLLAGLSSLSTGQVSITSNPDSSTGGIQLTSFGQSVSLPLSVLSALLTPLLPPGTSTAAVASTATYVAGLTCMLPCIGGSSSAASVSTTATCIGGCIDDVMPGTGTGGAKLVNDIENIMQPATQLALKPPPASSSTFSSSASHSPVTGTALSTTSAASTETAVPSSTAVSDASSDAFSPAIPASPTLSLTGSALGTTTTSSQSAQSSVAAQIVGADGAGV